jgi:hypothetical protein
MAGLIQRFHCHAAGEARVAYQSADVKILSLAVTGNCHS